MAGHSKWANIKRRKGAQDVLRGKLFSKLIKEITVAAKVGGVDPSANPRLRLAIDKAKSNSMPKNTIQRAVDKAAGMSDDSNFENLNYEGYGPAGVAVLVECLTDNRNRTASEVKHAFAKGKGNLGAPGAVAYLFHRKGLFAITASSIDEDALMEGALDSGAEDVQLESDEWVVTSAFEDYAICHTGLQAIDCELLRAETTYIPETEVTLNLEDARKLMALLERLDECDDVQETYTNADIPDAVAEQL